MEYSPQLAGLWYLEQCRSRACLKVLVERNVLRLRFDWKEYSPSSAGLWFLGQCRSCTYFKVKVRLKEVLTIVGRVVVLQAMQILCLS